MSISLSQGEATAIVVKAARGFGLSWGLAEEAGWALCQLGQYDNDVLSWFGHAFPMVYAPDPKADVMREASP